MTRRPTPRGPTPRRPDWLLGVAAGAAALAVAAAAVRQQTRRAEAAHPPRGRFVDAYGVRLHFTVHGRDDAEHTLVLLHDADLLSDDFELSGLVDALSPRYRVIVFDRPGHGWSERPGGQRWGPAEQADLLHAALARLGVRSPIVLGHGWAAMVALEMALQRADGVAAVVLVGGCCAPSLRGDTPLAALRLMPVLGPLLRHTLSPLVARLIWPLRRHRLFAPGTAPAAWCDAYPLGLAVRPGQLQAVAAESAAQASAARALQKRVARIAVPVLMVAGARDRAVHTRWHSLRLAERMERGWLRVIEDAGHMVHHDATGQIVAAVDHAARMSAHEGDAPGAAPRGLKAGDDARAPSLP